MHGDDAAGSTFTDSARTVNAPHTITTTGSVYVDTSIVMYGTGSANFADPGIAKLTLADSADWDFGTGDFCVEGWSYFGDASSRVTLIDVGGSAAGLKISFDKSGPTYRTMSVTFKGTEYTRDVEVPMSTWTSWAVNRYNGSIYMFVDGWVLGETITNAGNMQTTLGVAIGMAIDSTEGFDGNHDEIRISKGACRHTGNYTPSGPFNPWKVSSSSSNSSSSRSSSSSKSSSSSSATA